MIALLAGEDRAHFEAASRLAERILVDRLPWLDGVLRWHGPADDQRWFPLKDALRRARDLRLDVHGHFGGEAGRPEARQVRAQLLLWKKLARELARHGDAVILGVIVRDLDRHPERRAGAEQARDAASCPFAVALGFCVPEAEGWYLCAFEPTSDAERKRLAALTATLGFSPVTEVHRLTSTTAGSPRDAKAILGELCDNDPARRRAGLDAPIDHLRVRGLRSGLADFLDDLTRLSATLRLTGASE